MSRNIVVTPVGARAVDDGGIGLFEEDEAVRLNVDFQIVLHLPDGFPDAILQ